MSKRSLVLGVVSALLAAACQRTPPPTMVSRPPVVPQQQIAAPAPVLETKSGGSQQLLTRGDTAAEEHVQVETYGRDVDVRDILSFLGQRAGLRFVFAPEINKKVRVSMNDVPLSFAISTVLSLANLTLEGSNGPGQRPLASSVVFYELPVNVDSLSIDAIMKRFGVGRAVAEMLVEARTKRP
jgi:hypothetical protein